MQSDFMLDSDNQSCVISDSESLNDSDKSTLTWAFSLPHIIWDNIFTRLDLVDLARCLRLSRIFPDRVAPHLYRTITVSVPHYVIDPTHYGRCIKKTWGQDTQRE